MKTITSILCLVLFFSFNFALAQEKQETLSVNIKNPRSYTNKLTGLKFDYPPELYFDNGVLSKDKPEDINPAKNPIAMISFYKFRKDEIGKDSSEIGDFVLENIEKRCVADGVSTSSKCAKPVSVLPFETESGVQVYRILVTKIEQTFDEKGEVKETKKRKQGPSFLVTVPKGNMYMSVYIKLAEKLNFEAFEGMLKYGKDRKQALDTVRRIIESISFSKNK